MARPVWSGTLSFGLLNIPVSLMSGERRTDISFRIAAARDLDEATTILERTLRESRSLAARCDYPLHLGVTEAGTKWSGSLKSAVGLGTLLADGIDTLVLGCTHYPLLSAAIRAGCRAVRHKAHCRRHCGSATGASKPSPVSRTVSERNACSWARFAGPPSAR